MSAVIMGSAAGVGGAVGGSTALATGDPGSALHVAQGALAFTGFAVGLYLVVALSLMTVGFFLTRLGARAAKRAKTTDPPS
jgi:hypothetical protein